VSINKPKTTAIYIKITTFLILTLFSLLVFYSLQWNISNIDNEKIALATAEARSNWNKDLAFRSWVTKHGGVYVKPDKRTPPSPYLAHLEKRDVTTTDGMLLTLMNPAYILRQMTHEYEETYGVKGKITGKVLLNPINQADDWELMALTLFEEETTEVVEKADIKGEQFLRLMKPMFMQKGCEACHGHLGFKDGDLRGGISVSIPLKPYMDAAAITKESITVTHFSIWLIGLIMGLLFFFKAQQREAVRFEAQIALNQSNLELEEKVSQRTQELYLKQKEAKKNERQLTKLLQTTVDPIITIDEKGIIKSFNEASERQLQYSADEMIGKNVSLIMPKTHKDNHDQYLTSYLATGKKKIMGTNREVVAERKDGTRFPITLSISQIKTDDEILFIGILRNISLQKHHEKELTEAKEVAEKANLEKSKFLSSMSHELRTPLNSILGFGQLLTFNETDTLSENQKDFLQHIVVSGEHLLKLINDILDLAQIEAGKTKLHIEQININDCVKQCVGVLSTKAIETNIDINYQQPEKSIIVNGDKTRTTQVVLNLLSNAIKYNKPNGSISIDCCVTDDNRLRLSINDTGIGIAPKNQSALFKPFSRLGSELTNIQGTGIGLCICKELMQLMSGNIGFSSSSLGSTFWIELPLSENQKITPYAIIKTKLGPQKINGSILYIEDNKTNIKLLKEFAKSIEGLNMVAVESGEEGLELAVEKKFDLIIFDINLPKMSGLETMKKIRQNSDNQNTPMVALSAAASRTDIKKGKDAGFDEYLTKPVDLDKLRACIDAHIGV
jgi:PAS domain S-box-containing protein